MRNHLSGLGLLVAVAVAMLLVSPTIISVLNGLSAGPLLVTKGVLSYEQTSGTVNGVSWNPPRVYVQAAGVVGQLE